MCRITDIQTARLLALLSVVIIYYYCISYEPSGSPPEHPSSSRNAERGQPETFLQSSGRPGPGPSPWSAAGWCGAKETSLSGHPLMNTHTHTEGWCELDQLFVVSARSVQTLISTQYITNLWLWLDERFLVLNIMSILNESALHANKNIKQWGGNDLERSTPSLVQFLTEAKTLLNKLHILTKKSPP